MTIINGLIWLPIVTVVLLSVIFVYSVALHYYWIIGLSFVGLISTIYTMSAIVHYKELRDDELKDCVKKLNSSCLGCSDCESKDMSNLQ